MTWSLFTKRPYIEYTANSIDIGMMADVDANNLAQVRKGMAKYWTDERDTIEINRTHPRYSPRLGYVGFIRSKGLFFWVDSDGVCKEFNPNTGVLGKTIKIPARERKIIYDRETWMIGRGNIKTRSVKRRE